MMKRSRFNRRRERNALPVVFETFAALLNETRPQYSVQGGPGKRDERLRSHRGAFLSDFLIGGAGSGARSDCVALSYLCRASAGRSAPRIVLKKVGSVSFFRLSRVERLLGTAPASNDPCFSRDLHA